MIKKGGFTSVRDWLIALVIGCVLILTPYLVYAADRYFAVKAGNDWGLSDFSEEVSANIPDGMGCTLTWSNTDRATYYIVFWGKAPGEYIPPEGIPIGNETSHVFIKPPVVTNVTIIQ